MSPESRDDLANRIHENSLIDFTKSIGKKLDKASNFARCLALSHLVTKAGGMYNKGRKLDRWLKFKSLKDSSEKYIAELTYTTKQANSKQKKNQLKW